MTPEGVSEDEARAWVSAMINFFATIAGAWRLTLDDALKEVNGRSTDRHRNGRID